VVGLGASTGFLSGGSFVVRLASMSILHRYRRYKQMQRDFSSQTSISQEEDWHASCVGSNLQFQCPAGSVCSTGLCLCQEGTEQRWGQCQPKTGAPGKPWEGPWEGALCYASSDCHPIDINMVCVEGSAGSTCRCRPSMRWSPQSLECQVYLDVDCSRFTYTSPVSPVVSLAVQRWEERKRGYTTHEDRVQKLMLHTGLDEWFVSLSMHGDTLCQFWTSRSSWLKEQCQRGTSTWTNPLALPDPVFFFDRAETSEEALEQSLLMVVSSNMTCVGMVLELDELFCRDVEAFNEVFDVTGGLGRPPSCPRLTEENCATLYDSGTCEGSWQLNVASGEQRQLTYFSSDWTYRNDADVVGVRHGCSFTGFTDSGFAGDTFTVTAGDLNRLVMAL